MSLQMTLFHSLLWLSSIPLYIVNVTFICTGKPKKSCDLLYCNIWFTKVVWNQTWSISETVLKFRCLTLRILLATPHCFINWSWRKCLIWKFGGRGPWKPLPYQIVATTEARKEAHSHVGQRKIKTTIGGRKENTVGKDTDLGCRAGLRDECEFCC